MAKHMRLTDAKRKLIKDHKLRVSEEARKVFAEEIFKQYEAGHVVSAKDAIKSRNILTEEKHDYINKSVRGCVAKKSYDTLYEALTMADRYNQREYRCLYDNHYHLTSKQKSTSSISTPHMV